MRILGIDPGSRALGYAVLNYDSAKIMVVEGGVFNPNMKESFDSRLLEVFQFVKSLIKKHHPSVLAVEEPFYRINVKTALKLGEVMGAIKLAGVDAGIDIMGYKPRFVKQAVTGYGGADKLQVSKTICSILKIEEKPVNFNESDAIAVAYCCIKNDVNRKAVVK